MRAPAASGRGEDEERAPEPVLERTAWALVKPHVWLV